MRRTLVIAAALVSLAWTAAPPPTETRPVREVLHGTEVIDPYRWLEGSAAPEMSKPDPELDARVGAWTDAQNAWARSVLDNLPGRKELEARVKAATGKSGFRSAPMVRGEKLFFLVGSPEKNQPVLMISEGDAQARPLVDPNLRDPSGLTTIGWFMPSQDGRLVAVGLFRSGDENATLHLVEVETGRWLPDEIRNRVREVDWLPDSSGFVYNNLQELNDPYSRRIRFHKVGTDPKQDRVLLEQPKEGPAASTWGPFGRLSRDGRWLVLGQWTGSNSNDLWVMDFRQWLEDGKAEHRPIVVGQKSINGLPDVYRYADPIVGDTFYMSTTLNALNRRVVAVDLKDPSPERWRELIPERKQALVYIWQVGDLLAGIYLHDASTRIELFELDGTPRGPLALPGIGSADLAGSPESPVGYLFYTSFNEPPSLYRVNLRTGERTLWWREETAFDPASLEVKQVWYNSKDGTRVSMFVVHKKGLKLDGCNPTVLEGYGGFAIPMTPFFNSGQLPWFEDGGVFAIANLRGGGEFGEAWHEAGMFEHKQNTFDDFIAAAEWLIANGYTRPERLGITGASNGGLLTGAALTQRPELFSAAVSGVPLLDMLRFHNYLRARNWVSEYGSSADSKQFQYLRRYSPYHNVKKGTKYPSVLLTAGERDERVHPLHARKMTALLQASTASDPAQEPILLQVEREAGHGMGAPVDMQLRKLVDEMAFFRWQLGMVRECGRPLTP
ncbi:MAG TPA: prolyl oligopeptidase family serine peptidase [Thermoanaerobaculia bacterium]|nr:prolyl oligopeptidase family serine peptidase [Thermoanaerobaculia bacterium]